MNTRTSAAWSRGYHAISSHHQGSAVTFRAAKSFAKARVCRPRASGMIECLLGDGPLDNYNLSRILRIPGALLSTPEYQMPDTYVIVGNDVMSEADPSSGQVLESGFEMFGSVQIRDNFRIKPEEIDRVIPYLNDLVRYLAAAHVPGYRWRK